MHEKEVGTVGRRAGWEEGGPNPIRPLLFVPIKSNPISSKRHKGGGWVVGLEETWGESEMRSRKNGVNPPSKNDFLCIDHGPNKRRKDKRIELSGIKVDASKEPSQGRGLFGVILFLRRANELFLGRFRLMYL